MIKRVVAIEQERIRCFKRVIGSRSWHCISPDTGAVTTSSVLCVCQPVTAGWRGTTLPLAETAICLDR